MSKRVSIEKIPTKFRKDIENQLADIAVAIQAKREEMDLTQEELAEKLEITTIALQFIEQKRRYPSLPLLAHICKELKLKVQIG